MIFLSLRVHVHLCVFVLLDPFTPIVLNTETQTSQEGNNAPREK